MTTDTKAFHYADLLSATDGRLVSPAGMDGVYALFDWLAHDSGVTTLALLHLRDRVKAHLLGLFPELGTPAAAAAVTAALGAWKAAGSPADDAPGGGLTARLDEHVRPLLRPSYDVPRLPGDTHREAVASYGRFLDEKLAGKEVIAVVVPGEDNDAD